MITLGIFAAVDSGKTTLTEAILYNCGVIRTMGRVDHKTAFLDTNEIERNRGITVFSKEARFSLGKKQFVLLDTPGHKDFSAEMERSVQVLDYAILVVSAPDLVKAQTKLIWTLLAAYGVKTMVFVNKMDRPDADSELVYADMLDQLDGLNDDTPICYGSALKNEGISELLATLDRFTEETKYPADFAARVYKIDRDDKGNRQTHLRVVGGTLKPKQIIDGEKVQQVRCYNGEKFSLINEASNGDIAVVTGLEKTYAGQGLGTLSGDEIEPLILSDRTYRIVLPEGVDAILGYKKIRELAEEDPSLMMNLDELTGEIRVTVLGNLSLEILKKLVHDRFELDIDFDKPSVYVEPEELVEEELIDDRELVMGEEFKMSGNDEADLERIFRRTFGDSKRDEQVLKQNRAHGSHKKSTTVDNFPQPNWKADRGKGQPYLVIDGYNAMFTWQELEELIKVDFNAARDAFIDALQNYQGYKRIGMTVVFDSYKVKGGIGSTEKHGDITVIYTKEAETADRYIEEMIYQGGKLYDYTVVTSDKPVQMAAMGDGARRLSSREFYAEVMNTATEIREKLKHQITSVNRPFEGKL